MKRDTIRNTVTISDPRCVQWLRARMGEQYQLSSAIERAINRMLDLEQEVAFLQGVVQAKAVAREQAPRTSSTEEQQPEADGGGWNDFPAEYT